MAKKKPQPKPTEKRRPGRPEGEGYHPTPEQRQLVKVMAGMGIPEDQMVAAVLNPVTKKPISPVTLRKHFREELNQGFVQANAAVGAGLFKNATVATETYPGGIPVAQMFWLKCRARWQQNPERNLPPPPPADNAAELDAKDTARRLAFVLARGAHESDKAPPKPKPAVAAKPVKKRKAA